MTFIDTIITPSRLIFSAGPNMTVNGSSAIGNCVNESSRTTWYCNDPTSSVLFDNPGLRGIPTLTGLDGDIWASQLLTIEQTSASRIAIEFHFHNNPNFTRVDKVELVMFNCPQWGIGVESVSVQALETDATPISTTTISQDVTSCNSLMKVCLEPRTIAPQLALQFTLFRDSNWVHLAEVTFWVGPSTCTPNAVITAPSLFTRPASPLSTRPVTLNTSPLPFTSTSEAIITPETVTEEKTSTIITESSDIIALVTVTALLFLLFVGVGVVVLVLWRRRHQHTAKEEASHTSSKTQQTTSIYKRLDIFMKSILR